MDAKQIQEQVAGTYKNLRYGLIFIGIALPIVLLVVGYLWYGVPAQASMSEYYLAESSGRGIIPELLSWINIWPIKDLLFFLDQFDPHTPMRSWFVGLLFVLGVLMVIYRGFSPLENWLLNFAGLFAVGVALFPTGCTNCPRITLHGICAVSAFVCLILVAVLCSKQTLEIGLAEPKVRYYRSVYNWTAGAMLLFPVVALALTWILGETTYLIFAVEALGLWSFSAYWFFKSRELAENRAEERALKETLQMSPDPVMPGVPLVRLNKLTPLA